MSNAARVLVIWPSYSLITFPELCDIEAIEIVDVRIISARLVHIAVEPQVFEFGESWLSKRQSSVNQLDEALFDGVLNDRLVFVGTDRARGIHDVSAHFAAIDGAQNELLLQRTHLDHIIELFAEFDGRISGDDTQARARCIEQHAIKDGMKVRRQLASIQITNHHVLQSHAVHIAIDSFEPLVVHVIGHNHSGFAQQLSNVRGFAARSTAHIQHFVLALDVQCQGRQQRGRRLDHIISAQILRRRANRNGCRVAVVHFESGFAPLRQRINVETALNQQLGEVATTALERIGAQRQRPRLFVCFQKR
mmetsp:Transcript_71779/g.114249  ORF Transcript_71779/g.114249 Transcript_71779/m.114249 type:complete len:307 (+) Transcript_71779:115-1035(+)